MTPQDLAQILAQQCSREPVLGLSICVIEKGDTDRALLVQQGPRDLDEPSPVDAETAFPVASVTKVLVAFMTMQLVQEGRLDLDAPVEQYVTELGATVFGDGTLTTRRLLSHTSGIPDGFFDSDAATAVVDHLVAADVRPLPAGRFSYSNLNYALVGTLLERITGLTWEENLAVRLYAPLGLGAPVTVPPGDRPENVARDHTIDLTTGEFSRADMWPKVGRAMGAAGFTLHATARELALLALACLTGRSSFASDDQDLLSAELVREMQSEQIRFSAKGRVESGWALGWSIENGTADQSPTRPLLGHRGGTSVLVHADPQDGTVFAALANFPTGEAVARSIAEQVLGAPLYLTPPPVTLTSDQLEPLAGRYTSAMFDLVFTVDGDALTLANPMGTPEPWSLTPIGGRSFLLDTGFLVGSVTFDGTHGDGEPAFVEALLRTVPRA